MKTSARGIELIKQFEGLELEAYQDIAGVWTIGYGHTGPDVEPEMRISEREAEALLRRDLKPREDAIDRLSTVGLNQNEFDALVSFVFNVGVDAFRRSTARRLLNKNNRLGAADALTWWNKATVGGVLREVAGLTRRRAAERALFLTPTNPPIVREPSNIDENSRLTPIEDSPRRGNVAESRTVQGAAVAGGAGVAASTMGRDSAEELDQLETNIETGRSMTEDPSAREGSTPPRSQTGDETAPDTSETAGDEAVPPSQGDDVAAEGGEDAEDIVAETEGGDIVGEDVGETGTIVLDDSMPQRPSKHEVHAVESQIQFALLVLIVLAVLFIIIARVDDWLHYRR